MAAQLLIWSCAASPPGGVPAAVAVPAGAPAPRSPALCARDVAVEDLGIGQLRPRESLPEWGAEWLAGVELPLFRQPGDAPWAWLAKGWLVVAGPDAPPPVPLDGCGMVETDYETLAAIVLEQRDDGWFRIRYGSSDGVAAAWAHSSQLGDGEIALVVEPWETLFADPERSPYFFDDGVDRHALRRAPDDGAEVVAWIVPDHDLDPLELRGDWLRVELTQPSVFCETTPPSQAAVHEGWIRWRDARHRPLVWLYSRGC